MSHLKVSSGPNSQQKITLWAILSSTAHLREIIIALWTLKLLGLLFGVHLKEVSVSGGSGV